MQGQRQSKRAVAAVLGVMLCFGWDSASVASPKEKSVPQPSSQAPSMLGLDPQETQRAEAMAHYATAISIQERSGLDAALPEYVHAFELDPHHTQLAMRLAQIYVDRKDYASAVSVLERASKANPTSPEPWLGLGFAYRTNEQMPKAIAALKQALKLNPLQQGAMRMLLQIYLQQDAAPEAVGLLERAWKQQSKDASYWIGLGEMYAWLLKQKPSLTKQFDRNRVRLCYEKALALSPRDPDILLRLADVYLDASDYERAAEMYSKVLALRPDLPRLRERLALTYKAAGEKQKAVTVLEEIIKRDPLRFEAYNMLGDLYDDLDHQEKAIASYQQSLVLNPNQIEVYARVVYGQLRLKKYDDAFKTLSEAKEKFPTQYQVSYLYGLFYSDKKEYGKAVDAFADAEQLTAETSDENKPGSKFYFVYGAACERAGDIDKAAALFRKALELDPDNHDAQNYLGYMWADKGIHLDEALQWIEKAVQHEPDSGAYVDSLGWVLFKLGRYEQALPHLRRATELIKDDAVVFDHLGEALMKLGQPEEALVQWKKAHELEPDNKEIAEKLQRYTVNHTVAPTAPVSPQSPAP